MPYHHNIITLTEPLIPLSKALPHRDLFYISKDCAKQDANKVRVLLMLALDMALRASYTHADALEKFSLVLAALCAHSLLENFRLQFISPDEHHNNSYTRILQYIEQRVNYCFGINAHDRKRHRVVLNDCLSTEMIAYDKPLSIDQFIKSTNFNPESENTLKRFQNYRIHQSPVILSRSNVCRRTYFVYASIFSFSTLRLLLDRIAFACEHLHYLPNPIHYYHLIALSLLHVSCVLLMIQILFECAIIIRAAFYDRSIFTKLCKDNRPARLSYAIASLALIVLSLFFPVVHWIAFCGFELMHSLIIDIQGEYVLYAVAQQLKSQIIENNLPCPIMPALYQEQFLKLLRNKIIMHHINLFFTLALLIGLVASITLMWLNPFVCSIALLVISSLACINRLFMVTKMSETPGVPAALEKKCLAHMKNLKNNQKQASASHHAMALTSFHDIARNKSLAMTSRPL